MNQQLPTYYIPHGGGPCFFMPDPNGMWKDMERFLRGIAKSLPQTPKAVLMVSSHWEAPEFTLTTHPSPPLLYDYSGFPEHTYRLRYDAPGSPHLARRAGDLLGKAGIPIRFEEGRGWDHGVFIPLMLMFPDADVPVVQLSLKRGLKPSEHLAAGKALQGLRAEGVLIVGSGMSYHNMRGFGAAFTAPSERFDTWLTHSLCDLNGSAREEHLIEWADAPDARTAHPREEHLLSLMVAAGAASDDAARQVYNGHVWQVAVSGYRFG